MYVCDDGIVQDAIHRLRLSLSDDPPLHRPVRMLQTFTVLFLSDAARQNIFIREAQRSLDISTTYKGVREINSTY